MKEQQEDHNNKKKMLRLVCPTCGSYLPPLRIESENIDTSGWAKTAAYWNCISFNSIDVNPQVGDVLTIYVQFPVSCEVGGLFSSTFGDDYDKFITMELLNIEENDVCSATVSVRVVALGNRLSYVKPVSEIDKRRLRESRTYDYEPNDMGDCTDHGHINYNLICHEENIGGGDVIYTDYIFTDDDGIDHLVQRCFLNYDSKEAYFGDKVLGYHHYNNYFTPLHIMPNGSFAPEMPIGFMEFFEQWVSEMGVVPILQSALKDCGVLSFDTYDGLYTRAVLQNGIMYKVDVEVFLYAMKIIIGEMSANDEVKELYNELVRKSTSRSYFVISPEKYLF